MSLAMIVLVFFTLVIIVTKPGNIYTWLISLMIASIECVLFSLLCDASISGNYQVMRNAALYAKDYTLYLRIVSLPLNYRITETVGNIGVYLFMGAAFLLGIKYYSGFIKAPRWKATFLAIVSLILPLILYFANTAEVKYKVYLAFFARKRLNLAFLRTVNFLTNLIFVLYLAVPLFFFLKILRKSQTMYRTRQTLALLITMGLLDFIFLSIYFGGYKIRIFHTPAELQTFLLPGKLNEVNYTLFYNIMPYMILFSILILLTTLLGMGGLENLNRRMPRHIIKENERFCSNMRGSFHTFKNIFFSYDILINELYEHEINEEQRVRLEKIRTINQENLNSVSNVLNSLKVPQNAMQKTELIDSIYQAVKKLPENKVVLLELPERETCFVRFSRYQLPEVIENLVQNAMDAVTASKKENGRVSVSVVQEDNIAVVRIQDNGIGISKKDRNKIFEAFYSTKKTGKNWGLGLNYVGNVVNAQGALLLIDSKEGEGSTFELLIKKTKERK